MSCQDARETLLDLLQAPQAAVPDGIRAHLEGCPACRQELAEMREIWAALGRMEEETSGDRMRARFHAMLAAESAGARSAPRAGAAEEETRWTSGGRTHRRVPRPALWAALPAAALLAGLLVGMGMERRLGARSEIEHLRAEMRSMTQAVTLSLLRHQSASERLKGVGLCEATLPDDDLVQALLRVVRDDPVANVRLAALDVLASLPSRPDVRAELVASFPGQDSPPVKAAMAALLLELDGAEAVGAVRSAAADDRLPDSVRRYLMEILAERDRAKGAGT
ncbi:MAG TPA: hypothetical protein VJV23_02515 [Candidatus Polarisedimenticolia bacterium]|nr:hypothetical protein [Candidatus Polarisedimenticolia bacterium]